MKPAAERTDTQKQNLANIVGVMRFPEIMLVRHMQAATFLFREIAERATGGHALPWSFAYPPAAINRATNLTCAGRGRTPRSA